MDILAKLHREMNLAEMAYVCDKTEENKVKLDAAHKAYRDACAMPVKIEVEAVEQPKQEYSINEEAEEFAWIVHMESQSCYASELALAWMCEVDRSTISYVTNRSEKCPEALRELDLSYVTKIKNPKSGKDITAIPASLCSEILYYYAHTARGHQRRFRAKLLVQMMLTAGATAFIAKKAGYQFAMTQNQLAEEVLELKREFAELKKHFLQGEFSNSGRNQYGETPREAYFRKRDNWRDMYNWMRNWGKNKE